MMKRSRSVQRRGTVLPAVAVGLVGLFGFVALAVDIGMMAVARNQCQNAADAAAMAGARSLTGDPTTNNNAQNAAAMTVQVATANTILSRSISPAQVGVQIGSYSYDSIVQDFPSPPFKNLVTVPAGGSPGPNPTDNWSLIQASVSYQGEYAFAKVFGLSAFNLNTVAAAAHRPRDVAVVLDFSGSMRFGSLLGAPPFGTRDITGAGDPQKSGSNNPETGFPIFGAYSDQATAGLQNLTDLTIGNNQYSVANVTTNTADGRLPVVADFEQDTSGTPAFSIVTPDGSQNYAAASPGDPYLYLNGQTSGTTYAKTVADLTGSTAYDAPFETKGYKTYTDDEFKGYTRGPNYWGKTFFLWPPDPKMDWRQLYFGTTNNQNLWDSSGNWQDPGSGPYTINYAAILKWIKQTGPNPFPTQLRSGRIVYYTAIPDKIDISTYPPTDLNERFWKDYIDFVLGLVQTNANTWTVTTALTGYGGDFTWGTTQVSGPPSGRDMRYMNYLDNPKRPRLHFWFGPMTMVDFLGCYNLWYNVSPACSRFCWWPGTCHESPASGCKFGIAAALQDINNNHPNDLVSLVMYSVPRDSASSPGNRFNRVRAPLGRAYQRMQDALWYPMSTIENPGTTITPYDYDNNMETPRAMGGTCFAMPLMLVYNQFSASSSLTNYNPAPAPVGDAGGMGRKGAQKIIVLETDGLPNTDAKAGFTNNGAYNSYYNVRYNSTKPASSEFPTIRGYGDNDPTVTGSIFKICTQICALDTASPPGYSTARKPVLIHCIGFGPVFDSSAPERSGALSTLEQIQYIGKTQATATDPLPSYKIINGQQAQVIKDLQKAFTIILQGGVQISLLQ